MKFPNGESERVVGGDQSKMSFGRLNRRMMLLRMPGFTSLPLFWQGRAGHHQESTRCGVADGGGARPFPHERSRASAPLSPPARGALSGRQVSRSAPGRPGCTGRSLRCGALRHSPAQHMKLAFFGGTFDPIHHGHLILARTALEELGLDRVVFIPAALSPHKMASQPAPARESSARADAV